MFSCLKAMYKAKTRDNSVIFTLQRIIPKDAHRFADLRVKTGETSRPLFQSNMQSMAEIMELGYMVQDGVWGVEKTLKYLQEQVIPRLEEMYIAETPEYHSVLVFESPLLEEQKENEAVMLANNADVGPLSDISSCGRCGATKVNRKVKQTRSADEGATAIFTCPICKNTWNEN